jgi:hypothetical protein
MGGMPRVRLVHWKVEEAQPRVQALQAAGYEVDYEPPESLPELLKESLVRSPPAAVVIDLTRLPSHGRDVAMAIRQRKATRRIPLVFAEGKPEKVEGIRRHLPDAVYTSWARIRAALKRAIDRPPADPVKPESVLAGYSGTPLPRKLGIKPGSLVALVHAPEGFARTLGTLPAGVEFRDQPGRDAGLTLWFLRSRRELETGIRGMTRASGHAPLWMIWPKKTSGLAAGLTQQDVREIGLAAGWVDYKVCAVDATWSGLLFRRRKAG